MAYSADFCQTVALIAAKASLRWQYLGADRAAEFAWFSVAEIGDASVDDDDLVRHFRVWLTENEFTIPDWMI